MNLASNKEREKCLEIESENMRKTHGRERDRNTQTHRQTHTLTAYDSADN